MATTTRCVRYRRVSTTEQADSGLGLDAQAIVLDRDLAARGWSTVADLVDEGLSGSLAPDKRPALAQALAMLAAGDADALVVAKGDRITRTLGDLCELLDRSEKEGWQLVALDLGVDTSTPMGRAMAQIAGTFSELERKLIAQRTSDALQAKKAAGYRLGRPVTLGAEVRARIVRERSAGRTLKAIADDLNREEVATARGGRWHPSTIRHVLGSVALDELAAA